MSFYRHNFSAKSLIYLEVIKFSYLYDYKIIYKKFELKFEKNNSFIELFVINITYYKLLIIEWKLE